MCACGMIVMVVGGRNWRWRLREIRTVARHIADSNVATVADVAAQIRSGEAAGAIAHDDFIGFG